VVTTERILNPFDAVDMVCVFVDDTPYTTPGTGAYLMAYCTDREHNEYEFIVPAAGGV